MELRLSAVEISKMDLYIETLLLHNAAAPFGGQTQKCVQFLPPLLSPPVIVSSPILFTRGQNNLRNGSQLCHTPTTRAKSYFPLFSFRATATVVAPLKKRTTMRIESLQLSLSFPSCFSISSFLRCVASLCSFLFGYCFVLKDGKGSKKRAEKEVHLR